ncbi:hypothetical protein [Serinicoccus sp. LYQ131]|uniref:hypothetical protein n=1 Tax=Serinicoccus sp. LYQ131 TaxID=3378797 RepID=UPI003852EDF6
MTGAGPGAAGGDTAGALVQTELERVVRRWQQLPLDHALSAVPGVRLVVQELADRVATAQGLPCTQVPDLGPAVLMDQLQVMAYDWQAAGLPAQGEGSLGEQAHGGQGDGDFGDGDRGDGDRGEGLAERLTALRRSLP